MGMGRSAVVKQPTPLVCTGFVVMATVREGGGSMLRKISRLFASEQAAADFVAAARATYPDAYLHRVMRPERGRRAGSIR